MRLRWDEALALPGADQMRYARRLIESRPFFDRVPDRSLVPDDGGHQDDPVLTTRATDGAYAFVYVPDGRPLTLDLRALGGDTVVGHWFDPRRGTAETIGRHRADGLVEFRPPSAGRGNDWVLVLDDAARLFPLLGAKRSGQSDRRRSADAAQV